MSSKDYYSDQDTLALTSNYRRFNFGFHAGYLMIKNDEHANDRVVIWSIEGNTVGGKLFAGEGLVLDKMPGTVTGLSLKSNASDTKYRLCAIGV